MYKFIYITSALLSISTAHAFEGLITGDRERDQLLKDTFCTICESIIVAPIEPPVDGRFPLILTGTPPEQQTMILATNKPVNAQVATIEMQVIDPDRSGKVELTINDNAPITLFGNQGIVQNDNETVLLRHTTPIGNWQDGNNELTFRHINTAGFVINDFGVHFTDIIQTLVLADKSNWAIVSVSSAELAKENGAASNIIDNNLSSIWHSAWSVRPVPTHPHTVIIDMGVEILISGFMYTPRPGYGNGTIVEYDFSTSENGENWELVNSGSFGTENVVMKKAFPEKNARYFRLISRSARNGGPWASGSELDILIKSNQ